MSKQFIDANQVGGAFMSPDASPEARSFITACRNMLYADKGAMIKHAVIGAKTLIAGAVSTVVMLIKGMEAKLGPLSPEDERMVVAHLAGSIVEAAIQMGDPEAKADNGTAEVQAIIAQALQTLQVQGGVQPPAPEGAPPPPPPLMGAAP